MQRLGVGGFLGTVAGGPIGTLIGTIAGGAGGALLDGMLGTPGVFSAAFGAAGSEAAKNAGGFVLTQLKPEQAEFINHNLQRAFREAARRGLGDIAGPGFIDGVIVTTLEPDATYRFNTSALAPDKAALVQRCLAELGRAIERENVLPLAPPQAIPEASAYTYVRQTSLEQLSSSTSDDLLTLSQLSAAFFDSAIAPWLDDQFATLLSELPELRSHLREHLLRRTLVQFNEVLKDPQAEEAWRAFNRLLLEEVRGSVRGISAGQRELQQKLDLLLQSTDGVVLQQFTAGVGDLIAATGRVERRTNESLTALLDWTVEQHQEVVGRLGGLRLQLGTVQTDLTQLRKEFRDFHELHRAPLERLAWSIPPEHQGEDVCPYPGLAVFGEDDAQFFYGREEDIQRFLARADRPVTAITGPSGIGKSSFVLAGILPALRIRYGSSAVFLTHRISTSADPLRELALFLTATTQSDPDALIEGIKQDPGALAAELNRLRPQGQGRVVLVLDQFEELFVGDDKLRAAERARLLDSLINLEAVPERFATVLLTTRENYFEHPDYQAPTRERLRAIVQQENVRLSGLSDRQLQLAVERPLDVFNQQYGVALRFEMGVINLIVSDFGKTDRTLPLVQYLLRLLWTRQHELSKGAYATLGGLDRVLDRHANEIYAQFDERDQALVHAVMLALVRPGLGTEYTRRRVRRNDLLAKPALRERMAAVVQRLADPRSRLVSEQRLGEVDYLELTHEVLLRQWERLRLLIELHKTRLQMREALLPSAEQWEQSKARTSGRGDSSYLYRGDQLRRAREYTGVRDFQEAIDGGILACYKASASYRRRSLLLTTTATIVLTVAILAGVNWFTADARQRLAEEQVVSSQRATSQTIAEQTAQAEAVQRGTAEAIAGRRAAETQSLRLANQARQLLAQGNRSLAVTLALEANSIEDPPLQAQLALAEVAYAPGYVRDVTSPLAEPADECVFDTSAGRRVIRVNERDVPWTFTLYDAVSNTPIGSTKLDGINGNPPSINRQNWSVPSWCPQVSPDGNYALIGINIPDPIPGAEGILDGTLVLWDLASGAQVQSFPNFAGQAYFSPGGTIIAYATLDDNIRLWNIETQREAVGASRARLPFFWSPSGDLLLAAGAAEGEVAAFGVTFLGATEFVRWSSAGRPMGFAPDGASVYVENGGLQEWSLGNAAQIAGPRSRGGANSNFLVGTRWIAVSPATRRALVFSTGTDSGWVSISGKDSFERFEEVEYPGSEFGLTYETPVMSADGSTALVQGPEGIYRLDMVSGKTELIPITGTEISWTNLELSSDGSKALVAGTGSSVEMRLIELASGATLHTFEVPNRRTITVQLSPDDNSIAVLHGLPDITSVSPQPDAFQLTVWDSMTGESRYTLDLGNAPPQTNDTGFEQPSASFIFSNNGSLLATVLANGNLQLWDAASGDAIWSTPSGGALLMFSPDDDLIANGQPSAGQLRLLSASDGSLRTTLTDAFGPFDFSPDGTLIATTGVDETLRVFDVASGSELRRFDDAPRHIVFDPDGHSLFTASEQGVRRWRMDTLSELLAWTKANRLAAPLSCEQRVLYQVPPLCPPGTVATADPNGPPTRAPLPSTSPEPTRATVPTVASTSSAEASVAVIRPSSITASDTAPASQDAQGNTVSYEAALVNDGKLDTTWRVPGDGIGVTLTLGFDTEVEIHAVALVPGYAKIDPATGIDRFLQNRRVTRVRVTAGQVSVEANLEARPELQRVELGSPVRAQSVVITVLETTSPGEQDGRDFTPVSEVEVYGRP